jgi:hypothetical protein
MAGTVRRAREGDIIIADQFKAGVKSVKKDLTVKEKA